MLTGSLGVASSRPNHYDNDQALRLQFAADRIALTVENARLAELERLRRGSLSFLVEASDLLASTLERAQTLALMAQMAVPTLAAWCAVYTTAEQSRTAQLRLRAARGRGPDRRAAGAAAADHRARGHRDVQRDPFGRSGLVGVARPSRSG